MVSTTDVSAPRPRLPSRGLLLLSLAFAVAPASVAGQQVVAAGPNVRVSADGGDLVHVEPVIAVDPDDPGRMVAAAIVLRRPHASDWQDHQSIRVYASRDGGATWVRRALPGLSPSWAAGDPWLAWVADGTVLLSTLAGAAITRSAEPPFVPRLYRSADGGWSWSSEGIAPFPPNSAQDHPVVAVRGGGGGEPVVYVVGTRADSRPDGVDAIRVSPGTLAGVPAPALLPALSRVNLGDAVVLSDGALVVSYYSMRPPRSFWSARLDPETGAWRETRIRESILPMGFPPLALDASSGRFAERLHAAWVEAEDRNDLHVLSAWSDDVGRSWSDPVRVHTDTGRSVRALPRVSVAPDGAVGVVWQDRRNAGGAECTDLYGAISVDGGRSFLPEVRISTETACPGFENDGAAARRFRIGGGDYLGLAPTGPASFQAVWSDSRTGRYQVWTASLRAR